MQTTFFEINIFLCQYLCQPLPAEECTSNIFEDATSGTNVPKQYVPAVEKVSSICSLGMSNSYWKYSIIKPVFRGPLNIPEKVSLHDRCLLQVLFLNMGLTRNCFEKMSPDQRVSSHLIVP